MAAWHLPSKGPLKNNKFLNPIYMVSQSRPPFNNPQLQSQHTWRNSNKNIMQIRISGIIIRGWCSCKLLLECLTGHFQSLKYISSNQSSCIFEFVQTLAKSQKSSKCPIIGDFQNKLPYNHSKMTLSMSLMHKHSKVLI